jgi:uncharacterized protein
LAPLAQAPHLPYPAPIEAYGRGGFRFANMSHRGSLLCLPDGIWPWPVVTPADFTEGAFELVFARADRIGLLLVGTGAQPWSPPAALASRFHTCRIAVEAARTATAVSTYNILLGEGRRVAAGLLAVD